MEVAVVWVTPHSRVLLLVSLGRPWAFTAQGAVGTEGSQNHLGAGGGTFSLADEDTRCSCSWEHSDPESLSLP